MKKFLRQQLKLNSLKRIYLMTFSVFVAGLTILFIFTVKGEAQASYVDPVCVRPEAGSVVNNPPEIWNPNASHPAKFKVINIASGQNCYLVNGNMEAPTLRLTPGKKDLVLRLTNRLEGQSQPVTQQTLCLGGMAPPNSTSLHYHGLNVSPKCRQDEVVKTIIKPNETFEFNLKIPKNEPPGLYWYHPHIHMLSEGQVLSGLTGAIIIEGIKKYNQQAAKLPERVFVLRDLDPNTFPDSDTEQPAKDISINSVPIRYRGNGQYDPPAVIKMAPNQKQFWRVANTAADTYFDLQVTYDGKAQELGLVARDGIPINADGQPKNKTLPVNHILLPPGGRAEFIINGPSASVLDAKFLTLKYDTNADNDPQRTIARIDTRGQFNPTSFTSSTAPSVNLTEEMGDRFSGLMKMIPIQNRRLYFSQNDSLKEFYITVEGNTPKVYNPNFTTPDITVNEGTTEDWIVENRALEAHAFHIHQIHFLVLDSPDSSEIKTLRDTINLPPWDGNPTTAYPKVKLRMDFRGLQKGTSIAGTFLYHCHILEHEDGGMMAPIQVVAN